MSSVYATDEIQIPENPPRPTGYHLLLVMPKTEEKTRGGVYLPGETKMREDIASIIGYVVALGPDAYPETDVRFASGGWCDEGDWVMVSKYAGHRFECDGVEMRLLNDDAVLAVVDKPARIARAV